MLVSIAALDPSFVDDFTVKQLGIPLPVAAPEADSMTNLERALGRMLPANSSDSTTIQARLQSIRLFDVATVFKAEYMDDNFKPRVHAEAALLEYFYQNNLVHVNNYRYVGCSKPSCYCW